MALKSRTSDNSTGFGCFFLRFDGKRLMRKDASRELERSEDSAQARSCLTSWMTWRSRRSRTCTASPPSWKRSAPILMAPVVCHLRTFSPGARRLQDGGHKAGLENQGLARVSSLRFVDQRKSIVHETPETFRSGTADVALRHAVARFGPLLWFWVRFGNGIWAHFLLVQNETSKNGTNVFNEW